MRSSSRGSHWPAATTDLREAYALPLRDVELAALSACDTERGAYLPRSSAASIRTTWRLPSVMYGTFTGVVLFVSADETGSALHRRITGPRSC